LGGRDSACLAEASERRRVEPGRGEDREGVHRLDQDLRAAGLRLRRASPSQSFGRGGIAAKHEPPRTLLWHAAGSAASTGIEQTGWLTHSSNHKIPPGARPPQAVSDARPTTGCRPDIPRFGVSGDLSESATQLKQRVQNKNLGRKNGSRQARALP
jgi:hypothetical protein